MTELLERSAVEARKAAISVALRNWMAVAPLDVAV